MQKLCITPLAVLCSLHVPKIIKFRQGIQMLQAKTTVGTTLVGPLCIVRIQQTHRPSSRYGSLFDTSRL